ncbi:hypothetical protein [Mycolicibacterium sp. P1-18]|uniref:hypothetical protein n=1 Tax=Mycolicibacterium sp. P1-18 TaxID=2024615 RepID=UPI0011F0DD07|nr:hypothetical protein [Mycolicibacterium sp. P1-18]
MAANSYPWVRSSVVAAIVGLAAIGGTAVANADPTDPNDPACATEQWSFACQGGVYDTPPPMPPAPPPMPPPMGSGLPGSSLPDGAPYEGGSPAGGMPGMAGGIPGMPGSI